MIIEEPIDPRDIEWEIDDPGYRVYFWRQSVAPSGVPQERMGYACHEHRVSGAADVAEVLDWAHKTVQPDQTFVLYVEHRDAGRPGLLRLLGVDPTVLRDGGFESGRSGSGGFDGGGGGRCGG